MNIQKTIWGAALVLSSVLPAVAQTTGPRIAVTELAYQEKVREYFEINTLKYQGSNQMQMSSQPYSSTMGSASQRSLETMTVAGEYTRIDQGELRHFTSDLKGLILKGSGARLVQGKAFDAGDPQPTKTEQVLNQMQTGKMAKPKKQPDVNDIVARIKKGEFPGADYVLFGSISSVAFKQETMPIVTTVSGEYGRPQTTSTTTYSYVYGLDLGADFNLINTKTLEIRAAFSALGEGSETKLLSRVGDRVVPNKARVMKQTSMSLAEDAYAQLLEQLSLSDPNFGRRARQQGDRGGRDDGSAPPRELPTSEVKTFE